MDNEFQIDNWKLKIIVGFALLNLQIPIYGAICTFITRMHFRQMHKPSSLFVGNGLVPFRLQALSLSASNFSLSLCLLTRFCSGGRPCPPTLASSVKWSCIIKSRGFQISASLWWGRCRRRKERKNRKTVLFIVKSYKSQVFLSLTLREITAVIPHHGSDTPPECHSLPWCRFAYPRQREALNCKPLLLNFIDEVDTSIVHCQLSIIPVRTAR